MGYKKELLIYDKDLDFASDIKIYLEDMFNVVIVENIEKIIFNIEQTKPDILLFETNSFDQKSHLIFTKVKTIFPRLQILLMSTFLDSDNNLEKSILNQADDIIFKPFNVNMLKDKLFQLNFLKTNNSIKKRLVY